MSQQTHIDLDEAQSDAHTGMVVLNGVSCTHQKCSQASVSAVGTDHGQFKITHAVAVGVMPLRVNLLSRSYIKTKASPSNLAAISPISIHLRI